MATLDPINLRAFLPARDFAISKAFYTALGFRITWEDASMAEFDTGAGRFFLQDYYDAGWADNCMMNLVVKDVAAWWAHVTAAGVVERFAGVKVIEPKAGPHGTIFYLHDPSGVLWHIQQR